MKTAAHGCWLSQILNHIIRGFFSLEVFLPCEKCFMTSLESSTKEGNPRKQYLSPLLRHRNVNASFCSSLSKVTTKKGISQMGKKVFGTNRSDPTPQYFALLDLPSPSIASVQIYGGRASSSSSSSSSSSFAAIDGRISSSSSSFFSSFGSPRSAERRAALGQRVRFQFRVLRGVPSREDVVIIEVGDTRKKGISKHEAVRDPCA